MKVKTWVRNRVNTFTIEDEEIKNMILSKRVLDFYTYEEELRDIPLEDILGKDLLKDDSAICEESEFRYCNKLYDLLHEHTIFFLEKENIEYEIIEEGYPADIPWCDTSFNNVQDFHQWLLNEGKKEKIEEKSELVS